ncbi:uncharacterized protein LOC100369990 [Saccoglossus kowalevskii]
MDTQTDAASKESINKDTLYPKLDECEKNNTDKDEDGKLPEEIELLERRNDDEAPAISGRRVLTLADGLCVPVPEDYVLPVDASKCHSAVLAKQPQNYAGAEPMVVGEGAQQHVVYVVKVTAPKERLPHDWLSCSVVSMCCFLPLGLVAVAYSVKIQEACRKGDIKTAKAAVRMVKRLLLGALLCGIFITFIIATIIYKRALA